MDYSFEFLARERADEVLPALFDILYANMRDVAGMGEYEEEKAAYLRAVGPALRKEARKMLLVREKGEVVGFFQYYVNAGRLMMEEIQLVPAARGRGAFRALFEFLTALLPEDIPRIEAYAHRNNIRSRQILLHMGLTPTGEEDGEFLHFRGEYAVLRQKYRASGASEGNTMNILVMNGPNLNLLGKREPDIYGKNTYDDLLNLIRAYAATRGVNVTFFQSNHEGALVDAIQEAMGQQDGIVINPGAYTHTSVALLDAVKGVGIPTVEVHISDPDTREEFRHISYIRAACIATIKGRGFQGYLDAIDELIRHLVK